MHDEVIFYSVPNTANKTGLSKDYLYHLCRIDKIAYFKIGKKFMIHYPSLIRYLEKVSEENRHE